jgi:hypothetical protein
LETFRQEVAGLAISGGWWNERRGKLHIHALRGLPEELLSLAGQDQAIGEGLYRSGQAEAFARQVRAVADQALALFSPSYEETLERWSSWEEIAREEGGWAEEEEDVFIGHAQLVFALGQYHPKRTSYRTRMPYLKKDGRTFGFLKLNADALPHLVPGANTGHVWGPTACESLP